MKTPIVEYEGDQLEIDFSEIGFDLDRPQSSICPKCSSDIIRLADGCRICGWSENESKNDDRSVESSVSIPCTVQQPNQPEFKGVIKQDLGSRFLVDIPSEGSTVTVPKLFVYPDFSKLDKSSRKNIPASKSGAGKGGVLCQTSLVKHQKVNVSPPIPAPRRRKTHLVAHQENCSSNPHPSATQIKYI